jgi:hypothetical protein
MDFTALTKLTVVVIVCVAAFVLGYFGKLDSQAVVALLAACLGYVFGNAHGVISSQDAIQSLQETIKSLQNPQPPKES